MKIFSFKVFDATQKSMFFVELNEETKHLLDECAKKNTKQQGDYYIVYKPEHTIICSKFRIS